MDENGISSGLGSLALFEMGRQDERRRQRQDDAVSACSARLRGYVPVNVDAVLAENQLLRQNGDALWQDNQGLIQLTVVLQQQLQRQLADNQFLRQEGDTYWQKYQELKQLVTTLKREVQRQYDNKCEWIAYGKDVAAERDTLLAEKTGRYDDIPW